LLFAVALVLAAPASASWKEKVLYSFQGGANEGSAPAGRVVFDAEGNLYGATTYGGLTECAIGGECGTVFQLSPPVHKGDPWNETVIYLFRGQGVNDGGVPGGGLIIDAAGNLYGVTAYGGSGDCVVLGLRAGCGTVYELSPPKEKGGTWKKTILYSFPTAKQGYVPNGNLLFDSAGNLYGATIFGGGKGTTCDPFYQYCGAVFKLSPPKTKGGKWTEKVLHSFAGGTDGANPNGGLVLDSKGAIYGTTYAGGYEGGACGSGGCGTVFELKTPTQKGGAWVRTTLHRFGASDGGGPTAGVIFDGTGNLYGTTVGGGARNSPWGTVFQLAPHSNGRWAERLLYTFQDDNDGGAPRGGLVFDSMGNLYGTATGGGTVGNGTVFRLRPGAGGTWAFTAFYEFAVEPDGAYPAGGLIFDGSGSLYGTTQRGGSSQACGNYGCGTVFEVSP
jgi:uncharacterized repeat protein (TIGR03803 family)